MSEGVLDARGPRLSTPQVLRRNVAALVTLFCWTRASSVAQPLLPAEIPPVVVFEWSAEEARGNIAKFKDGTFFVSGRRVAIARAKSGDMFEVGGANLQMGLGYGSGSLPDTVVWSSEGGRLAVPAWSAARFVVVRSRDGRRRKGRLSRSAEPNDALWWMRFERTTKDWIDAFEPDARVPPVIHDDLHQKLLELRALQRLGVAAGVPKKLVQELLLKHFQRFSAVERPLSPNFMQPCPVIHSRSALKDRNAQARNRLQVGERLSVQGPFGATLMLEIRARAPGEYRVELWQNGMLYRVVEGRARAYRASEPWSKPLRLRMAVEKFAEIRVVRGELLVEHKCLEPRLRFGDLFEARAEIAHSQSARLPAELQAMLRWVRAPSPGSRRALIELAQSEAVSPAAAGLLALLAIDSGLLAPETLSRLLQIAREGLSVLSASDRARLLDAIVVRIWVNLALERGRSSGKPLMPILGSLSGLGRALVLSLQSAEQPLTQGAARPSRELLQSLETEAFVSSVQPKAVRRLRKLWWDTFPYRNASPEEPEIWTEEALIPDREFAGSEQCQPPLLRPNRWIFLRDRMELEVAGSGGSHALLQARSVDPIAELDSVLTVDGVEAVVHGSVGLGARMAVRSGRRNLSVRGGPLLLRLAVEGTLPCEGLRDLQRWHAIGLSRRFVVPEAASVGPSARVTVGPRLGRSHEVRVVTGPDDSGNNGSEASTRPTVHEAWIRGRSRAWFEVPLQPGQAALSLESHSDIRVRVQVRSAPLRSGRARRITTPAVPNDERPAEHILARLRAASRALSSMKGVGRRPEVLAERARALRDLGQLTLARADEEALGVSSSAGLGLEGGPDSMSGSSHFGLLSPLAPDVVVLNGAARIAPLDVPVDRDGTAAALLSLRRVRKGGNGRGPTQAPNHGAHDGKLLLQALTLEHEKKRLEAAATYAVIGGATGSPYALSRAARLCIEQAATSRDKSAAMRALQLGARARQLGDAPGALEQRLAPVLEWIRPAAVDSSAGTSVLIHERDIGASAGSEEISLAKRAKAALLLAPSTATLLSRGQRLLLHMAPRQGALIEGACLDMSSVELPCQVELQVAGRARGCQREDPREGLSGFSRSIRRFRCTIAPARWTREASVSLVASDEANAWISVRDSLGNVIPAHTRSSWHEFDVGRPLEFEVYGPTVVRLWMRALPAKKTSVEAGIWSGDSRLGREVIELNGDADPNTSLAHGLYAPSFRPGVEQTQDLIVEHQGRVKVKLSVKDGRALAIPRVATFRRDMDRLAERIGGGPRAVQEKSKSGAPIDSISAMGIATQDHTEFASEREIVSTAERSDHLGPAPLGRRSATTRLMPAENVISHAYGGRVGVSSLQLDEDEAVRGRELLELQTFGSVNVIQNRLWVDGRGVFRDRWTAPSAAGEIGLAYLPKARSSLALSARGRAVDQLVDANHATASRLQLGLRASWTLSPNFRVQPMVRATTRHGQKPSAERYDLDPEIFSDWGVANSQTVSAALTVTNLVASDALLRHRVNFRIAPKQGLDRFDLATLFDLVPGPPSTPWLSLRAQLSHRPTNFWRKNAFSRFGLLIATRLLSWSSITDSIDLRFSFEPRIDYRDASFESPAVTAQLTFEWQRMLGEGMQAWSPGSRLLRPYREEGSGLLRTRTGGYLQLPWEQTP
ncbi:MAG: hypothetical protein OEZ06_16355 [Myxococcales bacterium]|nr:hypothetical protein [Myxococcales bacterium]